MEFYIVQQNIWFENKLYEAGEYAKLDPADPKVQKLADAGLIESAGTLVDASEPIAAEEEKVQEQKKVEPEPAKEDPKLNKKGKRK